VPRGRLKTQRSYLERRITGNVCSPDASACPRNRVNRTFRGCGRIGTKTPDKGYVKCKSKHSSYSSSETSLGYSSVCSPSLDASYDLVSGYHSLPSSNLAQFMAYQRLLEHTLSIVNTPRRTSFDLDAYQQWQQQKHTMSTTIVLHHLRCVSESGHDQRRSRVINSIW